MRCRRSDWELPGALGPNGVFVVTFQNALGGTLVPTMLANGAGLTGTTPTVAAAAAIAARR